MIDRLKALPVAEGSQTSDRFCSCQQIVDSSRNGQPADVRHPARLVHIVKIILRPKLKSNSEINFQLRQKKP